MDRLFLVFVGGGLGSVVRYLVTLGLARAFGVQFPFGTLAVNLSGCLLMGFVLELALATSSLSPAARLALTTGFLGGLTTYSSFNYETTKLLEGGAVLLGVVNAGATFAGCLLAGLLGSWLGRCLFS